MTDIEIVISSDLVAALIPWVYDSDDRPHLNQLVFDGKHAIATTSAVLVRLPFEVEGLADGRRIGVPRDALIAALAAQDAIERKSNPVGVNHDLCADERDETVLSITPRFGRELQINASDAGLSIHIGGGIDVAVANYSPGIAAKFPAAQKIEDTVSDPSGGDQPEGFLFNPDLVALIKPVMDALGDRNFGVRIVGFSPIYGHVVLESPGGARFAILPMRPWSEETAS